MNTVHSKDGTPIAFDRTGRGPALILVTGAMSTRADAASVAAELAPYFTVFTYDRRGRGDSGDKPPYAVKREVEDFEAILREAGGTAFVFGHSSGAVLALDAANQLNSAIQKLAVYEPPFIVDDSRPPMADDMAARLNELVTAGRRGEAVSTFMTQAVLVPEMAVAHMQSAPNWSGLEAIAHTLVYDSTIVAGTASGKPLPRDRWTSVTMPTLVLDGGNSPAYMHHGAEALTALLPHAQHRRLAGQDHGATNEVLVPVLVEFFKG